MKLVIKDPNDPQTPVEIESPAYINLKQADLQDQTVKAGNPVAIPNSAVAAQLDIVLGITRGPLNGIGESILEDLHPAFVAWFRYVLAETYFTEHIKPRLAELNQLRTDVIDASGLGSFFQAPDGTVYHTTEKKGQWVDFTPYEIQRTRREGETKGSLALKTAEEAGFIVPGLSKVKEA